MGTNTLASFEPAAQSLQGQPVTPEEDAAAQRTMALAAAPELASPFGGGAEFRRGEAAGLAELEKGYENEDQAKLARMYKLMNGDAWAYPTIGRDVKEPVGGPAALAPEAAPAPTVDPMLAQLEQAKKLYAMYGGGVGAPKIGMNEMMKQGFAEQRGALGEVLPVMDREAAAKEKARGGMLETGQGYIDKLKELQAQQSGLFGARRGQMAEDEAKLASAEKAFDANRVLRNIGDSPVSTSALAFTAGLVGALKGQAGDMTPNQILGEVDKAIERDVTNQREEYSRMLQGIQTRRTHFMDARQMGADEQQALATATIASMDQHKRALEFAEARVTDTSQKAAIKSAIGSLKMQQGKVQFDIDKTNAANALSASKANRDRFAAILDSIRSAGAVDPKTLKEATDLYHSTLGQKGFQDVRARVAALEPVSKLLTVMNDKKVGQAFGEGLANSIRTAINSRAARDAHDGNAVVGVVTSELAKLANNTNDPQVRDLVSSAQRFLNMDMQAMAGTNVSHSEDMRKFLERTFENPQAFRRFVTRMEDESLDFINQQMVGGMYNKPFQAMLEANLKLPIMAIREHRTQEGAQARAEQESAGAPAVFPTATPAAGGKASVLGMDVEQ